MTTDAPLAVAEGAAGPAIAEGVGRDARPRRGPAPEWLLVALTGIGPASFQIFLPSLNYIQEGFGVTAGTAQLALSLSMVGIALATLVYGRLSDRWGRRPVLLAGMALLVAGSLICATAPHISLLILGRIVQAAGAASGMVVTRAIVLDLYGREGAGAVMARLLAAMMIAPLLATPVGGLLNDTFGWRSTFITIALLAGSMLALVWTRLEETRAASHAPTGLVQSYRELVRNPTFDAFALQGAFAMAAFIAFTTGAPYFITGTLGVSASEYGLWFILVSGGFAAGSILASGRAKQWAPRRVLVGGSSLAVLGSGLALGLALLGQWSLVALILPATLVAFANGLSLPHAQAGAIGAVPHLAGTASGLTGFIQTALGAMATQAVGLLENGTPYPVTVIMAGSAVFALFAATWAVQRSTAGSG